MTLRMFTGTEGRVRFVVWYNGKIGCRIEETTLRPRLLRDGRDDNTFFVIISNNTLLINKRSGVILGWKEILYIFALYFFASEGSYLLY